jgi:geranylgeranyl diphosphate synthase type II
MGTVIPIKELQQRTEKAMQELVLNGQPKELYEAIRYSLSMGGKRLRPAVLLASCNLFSENTEKAMGPALGIELFHNFTLLHDDIMDNAPLRRNKATVHEKWNNNMAILAGDTLFVKACELMMQCEDSYLRKVMGLFHQTAIEVCEGQQMDMNYESAHNISIPQYIQMITLKTAVLLAASFKIGAWLGGAAEEDAEHMYRFGLNLGIAFQLQDDILDVYGSPDKFGKQVGGDIISNKKTYLLLKALETADRYQKEELNNWIFSTGFKNEDKVEAVTGIYNFLGIKELAKKEFGRYYDAAFEHLHKVPVSRERITELTRLAATLAGREE